MKKKIVVTQCQGGNSGVIYYVQKTINVLQPEIGDRLNKDEITILINQSIEVEIIKPR